MEDDVLHEFAQNLTDSVRKIFFPCLPRVEVVIGRQDVLGGSVARYLPEQGIIEVSRGGFEETSVKGVASSLVHALVHAYGHLKGFLGDHAHGESKCFLCQAFEHGRDLVRLLEGFLRRKFPFALNSYPPIRTVDEDCPWDAFGPYFCYAGFP
ncbi:MAG TPA: hypothetical protein VNA19_01995 [Pyrinomonadaceae bacterium]|jgi:hypothetical protein|nr:hypothetical protein [Pyrinomonadaceae bacterium]